MSAIPVILDTDIGGDIDDTWALGMMLNCPELDVKLVVSDTHDTPYRSRLIAKMLEAANRTDIPVGIGIQQNEDGGPQAPWVAGYSLDDYPGSVHNDGVQAIIETIMESPDPITLICIGPLPNIREALGREPRIAENARFVGMHGSVYSGYGDDKSEVAAEYNVVADVAAAQKVFTAPWDITITPLDTCGRVVLDGEHYRRVLNSDKPIPAAVIENYRIWARAQQHDQADTRSSVLFDTVAVYLAFAEELLEMQPLNIRVDDAGFMRLDSKAGSMSVATAWKDLEAFKDLLVARLLA